VDAGRRQWRRAGEGGEGQDGWGRADWGGGRHTVWRVWGVDGWAGKAAGDRSGRKVRKGALVEMGGTP